MRISFAIAIALTLCGAVSAQERTQPESPIGRTLRALQQQRNSALDEVVNSAVARAQLEEEKAALSAKAEALAKQVAGLTAAHEDVDKLKAEIAELKKHVESLRQGNSHLKGRNDELARENMRYRAPKIEKGPPKP